jgi:hypothetical protein
MLMCIIMTVRCVGMVMWGRHMCRMACIVPEMSTKQQLGCKADNTDEKKTIPNCINHQNRLMSERLPSK